MRERNKKKFLKHCTEYSLWGKKTNLNWQKRWHFFYSSFSSLSKMPFWQHWIWVKENAKKEQKNHITWWSIDNILHTDVFVVVVDIIIMLKNIFIWESMYVVGGGSYGKIITHTYEKQQQAEDNWQAIFLLLLLKNILLILYNRKVVCVCVCVDLKFVNANREQYIYFG